MKSLLTGSQEQLSHAHSPPPTLVLYDFLCLVSLYTSVLSMADLVCVPQNHLPLTLPKYSIRKKSGEYLYSLLFKNTYFIFKNKNTYFPVEIEVSLRIQASWFKQNALVKEVSKGQGQLWRMCKKKKRTFFC